MKKCFSNCFLRRFIFGIWESWLIFFMCIMEPATLPNLFIISRSFSWSLLDLLGQVPCLLQTVIFWFLPFLFPLLPNCSGSCFPLMSQFPTVKKNHWRQGTMKSLTMILQAGNTKIFSQKKWPPFNMNAFSDPCC